MGIVSELVFDIEDWIDQNPVAAAANTGAEQFEIEEEVKNFKARVSTMRLSSVKGTNL